MVFRAARPVLLNGIEEVTKRPDLLDRALLVNLHTIPEEKRRTEAELKEAFDRAYPALIGAVLDALSCALRRQPSVTLPRMPRMADFAVWATAAEPARLACGMAPSSMPTSRTSATWPICRWNRRPVRSAARAHRPPAGDTGR